VIAPDSGLITHRDVAIGDISSPSKVLFTMVRQNQLELKAQIPEVELPRVRTGQVAMLNFNGKKIKGRIWQVSPAVDPATRLGEARIQLPLHSGLKTGMFLGGNLEMGTRRALTIPTRAVSAESGRQFVLVVNADRVHRRTVTTGIRQGDRIEVTSGLEVGEIIVVEGAGFLNDGDLVQTAAAKKQ
jgi:HlyD family secretion protein